MTGCEFFPNSVWHNQASQCQCALAASPVCTTNGPQPAAANDKHGAAHVGLKLSNEQSWAVDARWFSQKWTKAFISHHQFQHQMCFKWHSSNLTSAMRPIICKFSFEDATKQGGCLSSLRVRQMPNHLGSTRKEWALHTLKQQWNSMEGDQHDECVLESMKGTKDERLLGEFAGIVLGTLEGDWPPWDGMMPSAKEGILLEDVEGWFLQCRTSRKRC